MGTIEEYTYFITPAHNPTETTNRMSYYDLYVWEGLCSRLPSLCSYLCPYKQIQTPLHQSAK